MLDLNIGICSFKELIEGAFGDQDNNVVNFKVIQTVLYLLARQLGVLDRLVQVDFVSERRPSSSVSSITVSEIKIQATSTNQKIKAKNVNEKAIRRTDNPDIKRTRTSVSDATSLQSQSFDLKTKFITQGWPYNPSLDDVQNKDVNERVKNLSKNVNIIHTEEKFYMDKTNTNEEIKRTTNTNVTEKSSRFQANTASIKRKLPKTDKEKNINLQTAGEKLSHSRPEKRKNNARDDDMQQRSSSEDCQREDPESEKNTLTTKPKIKGKKESLSSLHKKDYLFTSEKLLSNVIKHRLRGEYRQTLNYSDELISRDVSHAEENLKHEESQLNNTLSDKGAEGINEKEHIDEKRGHNSGLIGELYKVDTDFIMSSDPIKHTRENLSQNAGMSQSQRNMPVTFQSQENYSLNVQEIPKSEKQKQSLLSKSPGYGKIDYENKETSTKEAEDAHGKQENFLLSRSNETNNLQIKKIDPSLNNTEDSISKINKEHEESSNSHKEKKKAIAYEINSLKEDFILYIGSLENIISINKSEGQRDRNKEKFHDRSYEDMTYRREKKQHRYSNDERSYINNTNLKDDHRYENTRYRSESVETYFKKSRPVADKYLDNRQLPFKRQNYHYFSERDTYDRSGRKPLHRSSSEEVISKVETFKEQHSDSGRSQPQERKTTFDFTKYIKLNKTSSEEVISKRGQDQKNASGHKSSEQFKELKRTEITETIPETKKRHDHSLSKPLYRTSSEEIYKNVKANRDPDNNLDYYNDEQINRRSEPRKRKNSKYEKFYQSSSDEFIDRQIKVESEKLGSRNKSQDQSSLNKELPAKRDGKPETPLDYLKKRTDKDYLDSVIKKEKSDRHHENIQYKPLTQENTFNKFNAYDNTDNRKLGEKEEDLLENKNENIFRSDYSRVNNNNYDYANNQPRIKINDNNTQVEQRSQNKNNFFQDQPTNKDIDSLHPKQTFDAFDENISKLEKLRQAIMSKCTGKEKVEQNNVLLSPNLSDKEEKTYLSFKDALLAKSPGRRKDKLEGEITDKNNRSHIKNYDHPKDASSYYQKNLKDGSAYYKSSKKQLGKKAEFTYQYPSSSEDMTPKKYDEGFDTEVLDKKKNSPKKFNVRTDRTRDQVDPYLENNNTSPKRHSRRNQQYQSSSEEIITTKINNYSGIDRDIESDMRSETTDKNVRHPIENKSQYREEDKKRSHHIGYGRYAHVKDKPLHGTASGELFLNQEKDFDDDSLVNDISGPIKNKHEERANWLSKKKPRMHHFKKGRVIVQNPEYDYDKITKSEKFKENANLSTDGTMSIYDKLRQAIMSKSYGRQKEVIELPQSEETTSPISDRLFQNQLETQEKHKRRNLSHREPQTSWPSEELIFKESKQKEKNVDIYKDPVKTKGQYDRSDHTKPYQSSSDEELNQREINERKERQRDKQRQLVSDDGYLKKRKQRQGGPDDYARDQFAHEDIVSKDLEHPGTGIGRDRQADPMEKQYRSSSEETIKKRDKNEEKSSDYRRDRPRRDISEIKDYDHSKKYRSSSEELMVRTPKVRKDDLHDYSRDKQQHESSSEETITRRRRKRKEDSGVNKDISARDQSPPEDAILKYPQGPGSTGRPEKQEIPDINKNKENSKRETPEYDSRHDSRGRSQYQSSSEDIMAKEHSKEDPGYRKKSFLKEKRSPVSESEGNKLDIELSRSITKKEDSDTQRGESDYRPALEGTKTQRDKKREESVDYDKVKKHGEKQDRHWDEIQHQSPPDNEILDQERKSDKKKKQKVNDKQKLRKRKAVETENVRIKQAIPDKSQYQEIISNEYKKEDPEHGKEISTKDKPATRYLPHSQYEDDKLAKKRYNQNVADIDKLGTGKAVRGWKETSPEERENLKQAAPYQGYDTSDKVWPSALEDEELKLKLKRQREAMFAKCPGYEPESTLKRDNTLSYKHLINEKILKSSSEDDTKDGYNKPKYRSRTKERSKVHRTRSLDSSLSDEIAKYDNQLGALFSQSPGFTEMQLEPKHDSSDEESQSYKAKDGHIKSSYDKKEDKQKDRSETAYQKIKQPHASSFEEVITKPEIKEKSRDYSEEKGKKKRAKEYEQSLEKVLQSSSEVREKPFKERAIKGRPESVETETHDQPLTKPHRHFSNDERAFKHKERSTSTSGIPAPLKNIALPSSLSDLGDWHIDSSGSRIDVKSKDRISLGQETIIYDKDKETAARTKKSRLGEDNIEREDGRDKYKRVEDKLRREIALQEEKDKHDVDQSVKRKVKKEKYSPDESMGSIIEEDSHKPYDERHKYDQATETKVDKDFPAGIKERKGMYDFEEAYKDSPDEKYSSEDLKERKKETKRNEDKSAKKEYIPSETKELSQKEKFKTEGVKDEKQDGQIFKDDISVKSKGIERDHSDHRDQTEQQRKEKLSPHDFQETKHTKDKIQPDTTEDRRDTLKSGIDSARQEKSREYAIDKKYRITSRGSAEIAHTGGKDTKLDDNILRSPDGIKDSIKSKDTENEKADSKKDGVEQFDQKITKSPQIDKQVVDDVDSKKLQDSAKLEDGKSDPKRSKPYDEDEGAEVDYAKAMGSKGGKKLDVHGVPLEVFEELREQELRVINQRADSREEPDKEPPTMLSVPSAERALAQSTKEGQKKKKEKSDTKVAPGKLGKRTSSTGSRRPSQDIEEEKSLVGKRISSTGSRRPSQDIEEEKVLVVERIPLDKEKAKEYKEKHKATPLAVVKLEEFQALVKEVKELETRMRPASKFSFPGNAELLEHIRSGASLTEAMAALQLSARIEAAENALENIIEMVSKLAAQNPEVDIDKHGQPVIVKLPLGKDKPVDYLGFDPMTSGLGGPHSGGTKCREGCITKPDFDQEILKVQKQLAKEIGESARKNLTKIDVLAKNLKTLESKVEDAVHMSNRISDLEDSVSSYSERINAMDTGLSVQMTSYQDQLTQMQHELEEGLENMAETLANAEGDPAAVAELHSKLNSLQDDLLNTSNIQSELEKNERDVLVNLKDLFTQIEHLRETKADREEVEDALQNKAGLSALNGLISLEHFDALIGDMETHIGKAYDKFNNQELIWQKAINDLVKELNEKTNLEIVLNLRDDINNKLNMMTERISSLRDIVGEPRAFGVSKRINVGAECLSCKTPAQMEPEAKPTRMPAMKTSSASGGGAFMKEAGDACYPGYPIPHPLDPRTHICNRYCGGSHTVLKSVARAKSLPGALTIKKWEKPISTAAGTDGKAYLVEDPNERGPCKPCNIVPSISTVKISPKPSVPVKGSTTYGIEIVECNKCPCFYVEPELDADVPLTG